MLKEIKLKYAQLYKTISHEVNMHEMAHDFLHYLKSLFFVLYYTAAFKPLLYICKQKSVCIILKSP